MRCVAVYCSVLQCVAVYSSTIHVLKHSIKHAYHAGSWLIHMCETSRSYVTRPVHMYILWLIHVCGIIFKRPSQQERDSRIRVTWLVGVWLDWRVTWMIYNDDVCCSVTWVMCDVTCDMTRWCVTWLTCASLACTCRMWSLLQGSFAKETYNLIDVTNEMHLIQVSRVHTYTCNTWHYMCVYIYMCHVYIDRKNPPRPGGFCIYYVPWSRAVCKRFHDEMRRSHLVVKSLTHGSWSGNHSTKKPSLGGGFPAINVVYTCLCVTYTCIYTYGLMNYMCMYVRVKLVWGGYD